MASQSFVSYTTEWTGRVTFNDRPGQNRISRAVKARHANA
jgi:hypothetical protein